MNAYLKSFIYLLIFVILHFGYEITHWSFLIPFCGINESVFQHLKMAFWAYNISNFIEYLFIKEKNLLRKGFWLPRLLSAVLIPYFTMIIWYLAPALFGKFNSNLLEVIWAIVATYFSGVISVIFEKEIEKDNYTLSFKIFVALLVIFSAFLFIVFTFKAPWIDLFVNPESF